MQRFFRQNHNKYAETMRSKKDVGEWHRWNQSGFLTTGTGSGLSRSYWAGWSTGLTYVTVFLLCSYFSWKTAY
jgi:hypothetical protein